MIHHTLTDAPVVYPNPFIIFIPFFSLDFFPLTLFFTHINIRAPLRDSWMAAAVNHHNHHFPMNAQSHMYHPPPFPVL